jgi:hypothetical protein
MSTRQRYPSDLTDLQRDNIEHLFPPEQRPAGRAAAPQRGAMKKGIVIALVLLAIGRGSLLFA